MKIEDLGMVLFLVTNLQFIIKSYILYGNVQTKIFLS